MNENSQVSPKTAIEVVNLSKRFDSVSPVQNVTVRVERGEFVTLLGPSGSGKSTLLSLIAGFEKPSEGSVSLEGLDITSMNEDELALMRRKSVGFVFQDFHLIPTLSAIENVAFPLYPVKMDERERRRRAEKLLGQMGLAKRATHLPAKLSGGERQRIAIARALINEPSILFCDEPTGNLDSKTGEEILNLLVRLKKERGVTLFMVTHDQKIAKRSNRSLFMHDGEVSSS